MYMNQYFELVYMLIHMIYEFIIYNTSCNEFIYMKSYIEFIIM
jgi:hypothetical protein